MFFERNKYVTVCKDGDIVQENENETRSRLAFLNYARYDCKIKSRRLRNLVLIKLQEVLTIVHRESQTRGSFIRGRTFRKPPQFVLLERKPLSFFDFFFPQDRNRPQFPHRKAPDKYECTRKPTLKNDSNRQTARV